MHKTVISDTSTLILFHKIDEFDDVLLLLDDLKARKLAVLLKFKITSTLGVIHRAKQMTIIEKVKPLIDKLLLTDFRIAENIIDEILKLNNE